MAGLIIILSLASGMAVAETAKKKDSSASYDNNPTIGVLGGHRPDAETVAPVERHRAPSAPIAAPALPKVEAETPQVNLAPTAPLPAAPRPDVAPEGAPAGMPSAGPTVASLTPPTGFLPTHPFLSGLVAGLVGTGLGSLLYGGPMMGDESAAMIGFVIRIAVFGLALVLALRAIAGVINRSSDDRPPRSSHQRREPTFDRHDDTFAGRREPHFSRRSAGRGD